MSALSVVLRDDEMLLVADRAAVHAGVFLAPEMPVIADDQSKLFVTPNRLAVGVLGHSIVNSGDGVPLDLLDLAVTQASSGGDAGQAAAGVRAAFEEVAVGVRTSVGGEGGVLPPFHVEVLTAVLVTGFTNGIPLMFAAGLTVDGPCALEQVSPPGIGWGPRSCVADLGLSVMSASSAVTTHDALEIAVGGVRSCSVRLPALVSPDIDYVVLRPGCTP